MSRIMGDMTPHRQPRADPPVVIAVAGPAGSGKTTLGRALAMALGLPLLDLDQLTNPLLDRLTGAGPGGQWLAATDASVVRDGRYAALRATAADIVSVGVGVVLVAPFTSELAGGDAWTLLNHAVEPSRLTVVHLSGPPALLQARRQQRAEARDTFRHNEPAPPAPVVEHLSVEAAWTTDQQLSRVLNLLGHRAPVDPANAVFSMVFDAVLFDLDGTLVDSTPAVIRAWSRLAAEFGFDAAAVQQNHGMTALNLLRQVLEPSDVVAAHARITHLEVTDTAGVTALPGAAEMLAALPASAKAIVTSGGRAVALARMTAGALSPVDVLVTADDVSRGKPDPQPYLLAAQRLGVAPSRCLVVEDAPAGVTAARRAGCTVIGVGGTCDPGDLEADLWLDGLDQVRIVARGTGVGVELRPSSPTTPSP